MNNDNTVFSALEDAVSAMVAEKHGPDCVVGSWVLVAESIAPEDGKDRSAWLCEGQGSPLSRLRPRRVRTRHVRALSEEVRR